MIRRGIKPGRQLRRPLPLAPAASADELKELVKAVAVEGAEEVAELRQQRGEVPAGRRQGGEGPEQDAHGEHRRRRRPHDAAGRRMSRASSRRRGVLACCRFARAAFERVEVLLFCSRWEGW